jgi:hypothetical protein
MSLTVAFGQRIVGVFRDHSVLLESRIPSISSLAAIPFSRNLSGGFSIGPIKSFLSNEREGSSAIPDDGKCLLAQEISK